MFRFTIAILLGVAVSTALSHSALAGQPQASEPHSAAQLATQTPTPGSVLPSETVSLTPRALMPSPTLPPTPGPPTPTPKLPEEGGPPGAVLGGHIYYDIDASRSRTAADAPVVGAILVVDQLDDAGVEVLDWTAVSGPDGRWELRALPAGQFRIMWEPSPALPEDQWPLAVPAVEAIVLNPADTAHDTTRHAITRTTKVVGTERILDIDFGIPPPTPMVANRAVPQLPSTGDRPYGGFGPNWWLLSAVLLLSAAAGVFALRRR